MGLYNVQSKLFQPARPSAPLMSEATSVYLRLKGDGDEQASSRLLIPVDNLLTIQGGVFWAIDETGTT